jgi:hypothetical protein
MDEEYIIVTPALIVDTDLGVKAKTHSYTTYSLMCKETGLRNLEIDSSPIFACG